MVLAKCSDVQAEVELAKGLRGPGRQASTAHRNPGAQTLAAYSCTPKADLDKSANHASEVNVGSRQH